MVNLCRPMVPRASNSRTICAPIVAGTLQPFLDDERLPLKKRCQLDRLYVAVDRALQAVCHKVGLKPTG